MPFISIPAALIVISLASSPPAARWRAQESTTSPHPTFSHTTHDFGAVTQGVKLSHTFTVRNTGTAPLRIEGVELQAPGMKTSLKPVIAPGETVRITIDWDTSQLDGEVVGKAVVRFAGSSEKPVELVLTATVNRSIDILPMPAVFFSVYAGETATRSVTIVNRESQPLEITGIEPAGDHFKATITAIKPGETYRLDVSVPGSIEPGRFMEAVYLNTNHPSRKRLKVAVNVFVKNELYVNPEALAFGQLSLAELSANPQIVRLLENRLIVRKREGDFSVKSVSTDVPGLKVAVTSQGRAQAFQIDVTVVPEKLVVGRMSGTIRIETDDEKFPVLEVPVSGAVR